MLALLEVESADGEFLSSPPDPVWIGDLFDLVERSLLDDKIVEVEYDEDYHGKQDVATTLMVRMPAGAGLSRKSLFPTTEAARALRP